MKSPHTMHDAVNLKVVWCAEQGQLLRHLVYNAADSSVLVFVDTKQPHPVKLW